MIILLQKRMKKIILLGLFLLTGILCYSQTNNDFKTNEAKRYWHNKISTDNYVKKCSKLGILIKSYTLIKKNKFYPVGFYIEFFNPTNKTIKEIEINLKGFDIYGNIISNDKQLICSDIISSKQFASWTFPNVWKDYNISLCQISSLKIFYTNNSVSVINDTSEIIMSGVMLKWIGMENYSI